MANRTVHGVMHIAWVTDDAGDYRGQMAVLVKPNGLFGKTYMAAIAPFRHLLVYPPLMREIRSGGQDAARSAREPWRHGHLRMRQARALIESAERLGVSAIAGSAGGDRRQLGRRAGACCHRPSSLAARLSRRR